MSRHDAGLPPPQSEPTPPGEGWVPWSDVVYMAEAGVPRGYALRQGKRVRAKERQRVRTARRVEAVPTDEQRGIRHVALTALRGAIRAGYIERQGGWCRLLRDPVRSPRPWLEAAFHVLGRAHPTLTGEWQLADDAPWRQFHVQLPKQKP